jgi:hypothetical protein
LEGSLLRTTAIPSTSANACICRWRRNVPGGSFGRCNAFADALRTHLRVNGKGETHMKDDVEDYPVSYLLYVSFTSLAIALVGLVAFIFLL